MAPAEFSAVAARRSLARIESRRKVAASVLSMSIARGQYTLCAEFAGQAAAMDDAMTRLSELLAADAECRSRVAHAVGPSLLRSQLDCEDARDDAIRAEAWEKVSRLDGMAAGYLLALRIVSDEWQPARRPGPLQL